MPHSIKVRSQTVLRSQTVYTSTSFAEVEGKILEQNVEIRKNEQKLKLIDFVYYNGGLMFKEHLAHKKGETSVCESN